jgi:hypothetical protein
MTFLAGSAPAESASVANDADLCEPAWGQTADRRRKMTPPPLR